VHIILTIFLEMAPLLTGFATNRTECLSGQRLTKRASTTGFHLLADDHRLEQRKIENIKLPIKMTYFGLQRRLLMFSTSPPNRTLCPASQRHLIADGQHTIII